MRRTLRLVLAPLVVAALALSRGVACAQAVGANGHG